MDCKSGRLRRAAIYLLALISGATGVRNLEMIVPAIVKSGDSARLSCHYILEGAPLYTIQWYFGEQEFYHYLPKKLPPQVIHPLPGIDVDILHSDVNDVTLRNVTREAAGTYKCEVSEDSPTYHTVGEKQNMHVADVPETGPVIDIEKQRLPSGDTLRANCTSGASHPAPNVTWTMNGEILNATTLQFKTWTRNSAHGKLEATQSSLELQVFSRMFRDGRLRLGCRVNISGVYSANVEMDINEDRPLIASITGDASPHSDRSSVGGHGGLSSIRSSQGLIRAIIMSGSAIISIVNLR